MPNKRANEFLDFDIFLLCMDIDDNNIPNEVEDVYKDLTFNANTGNFEFKKKFRLEITTPYAFTSKVSFQDNKGLNCIDIIIPVVSYDDLDSFKVQIAYF